MSYYTLLHQLEEQQKKKSKDEPAIEFLKATAAREQLGICDIGTAFVRCATDLFAAKYDGVSALVVHFKKLPSVMTVGGFHPTVRL